MRRPESRMNNCLSTRQSHRSSRERIPIGPSAHGNRRRLDWPGAAPFARASEAPSAGLSLRQVRVRLEAAEAVARQKYSQESTSRESQATSDSGAKYPPKSTPAP